MTSPRAPYQSSENLRSITVRLADELGIRPSAELPSYADNLCCKRQAVSASVLHDLYESLGLMRGT